jgi:hypothetical protein
MRVDDYEIIITGKSIKTAKIELEDDEDIEDPESFIERLKKNKVKADIFTFWQRVPETTPKYSYYMEWDNVAALQINSFDHWWEQILDTKNRTVVRKAQKKGVVVKVVDIDDEFVKGIHNIYNETPIRQGKHFWHYGKDFDSIKKENSTYLNRSEFIGAYYNDELMGFIRLMYGGRIARTVQIVSKIEHRDKAPNNALIAKAVELLANKKIPYFIYSQWPRGPLADFKRHNGFKKINVPRYYIPLTIKGKIALKLGLHHGITGRLPEKIVLKLIDLRTKWYSRKLKNAEKV